MGYKGAKKITIVDLHPDVRSKKALEPSQNGTFSGTDVEYRYHSMADLTSYRDNSFDFVWAGQTIEHVTREEGDEIFRQVARILKPGGFFALDTSNRTLTRLAVGETGFIHAEHKYEFRFEEFVKRYGSSRLAVDRCKGLINMARSIEVGYLLPDEIANGEINDHPETSFVFYVTFRKTR